MGDRMMMTRTTLAAVVAACALAGAACSKKDAAEGNETEGAAKTTAAAATKATVDPSEPTAVDKTPEEKVAEPAAPSSNIKIDEEIMAEIKKIASTCEFDKSGSYDCKNDEDDKLFNGYFRYGEDQKDLVASVGTIAVAVVDSDKNTQVVAAKILGSKYNSGWGPKAEVGQVEKEVSAMLRSAIPNLGMYPLRNAMPAIVMASSLSNSDAEMYAVLEGLEDKYAQSQGWASTMYYGRMKAFEKVKGLAATGDPKQILTAVKAGNGMYKYTDEERAELCPWAHALLGADPEGAKESDVFEQAASILMKCSGESVDKLLDWGEAQRKENHFDRKYYFVYRELCHSIMKGVDKVGATPEQCERNWKYLEKTANTKGIDPQFRAWALDSISYSRRDAKSYKLMKKYAKSKVPEIKKVAKDALEMLEGYVKKK